MTTRRAEPRQRLGVSTFLDLRQQAPELPLNNEGGVRHLAFQQRVAVVDLSLLPLIHLGPSKGGKKSEEEDARCAEQATE